MERPVAGEPLAAAADSTPTDRLPQLPPARADARRHRRVPGTVDRRHTRPGRDRLVRFRYSAAEYAAVSDAARRAGYTVSGYVAEVALAAAGERDEVRPAVGVDRELLVALNARPRPGGQDRHQPQPGRRPVPRHR